MLPKEILEQVYVWTLRENAAGTFKKIVEGISKKISRIIFEGTP